MPDKISLIGLKLGRLKHGYARRNHRRPIYNVWTQMLDRCNNPNNCSFYCYGARGIKVCERWFSFPNFLADMGEPPRGMSLGRIKNDGNYEPSNCEWQPPDKQARNTRRNRIFTINGITACMSDLCRHFGFNKPTISQRINAYGWTPERAFNTPVKRRLRGCSDHP